MRNLVLEVSIFVALCLVIGGIILLSPATPPAPVILQRNYIVRDVHYRGVGGMTLVVEDRFLRQGEIICTTNVVPVWPSEHVQLYLRRTEGTCFDVVQARQVSQ